ncbi:hypothetical protein ACVIGA_000610 [Bradyrhizobium sp. USDA 3240]
MPPKKKPADLAAKLASVTAVLVAVGALIAAATPIYQAVVAASCKISQWSWCEGELPKATGLAIGATGWIYVGTRVGNTWDVTKREEKEPPLTLQTGGLPQEGDTYAVLQTVYLREKSPEMPKDGSRPEMTASKGVIGPGSKVKVDKVVTYDLKNPDSTWVFAHITLIGRVGE